MNGNMQKKLHALIGGFLRSPHFKSTITKDIESFVKLTLSTWQDMDLILVQEETKKITFQVLVKVLMSVGPGQDLDFLKKEFEEFIKGLICLPIKFPGTRLYKSLKAKEKLLKMVKKIVEERKIAKERSDEKGNIEDTVDLLLREYGGANDMQSLPLDFISGNILEMMIPGEETVPMAMTLAVKFLSDCPRSKAIDVYLTCNLFTYLALTCLPTFLKENMELKRHKTESCEDYNWTDYMSLRFTQNVINETLRMANIINGVWRKALKDVEIKGNLIPQGWCVLASFTSVHMDKENYDNPCHFDPWRWEKTVAAVNNCFTPFGGGQRLCPGLELSRLEISIFLHHLVTTYRWTAEKDDIVYFPTVRMRRKLPTRVTSYRNSTTTIDDDED
ncbi:hypothetical protein GH714_015545 [Hevea brasiliensis]|uniref:3-epi-6-deoxocathasterone 23-monooxygenase n=1 Tax=Hevea brasiliensis TaxID=3981 RepID=A0A6A6KQL5_HEVBR|nr:hypothetical protein GH714_015545 [Hevea brasiliensis]